MLHSSPRAARILSAATLLLIPSLLRADGTPYYFVGPTNSLFSDPNNWATSSTGPGGSPPGDSDDAIVSTSSNLTISLDSSPNNVSLGNTVFSADPGSLLTIQQTGSLSSTSITVDANTSYTLSSTGSLSAATAALADQGSATFSQSGGVASFTSFTLANTSSSSATLNLSGGTFGITATAYSPDNYVGYSGTATVNQTGGTFTLGENINHLTFASQIGSSATYNLSAGLFSDENGLTIGDQGSATFNQTGGTYSVENVNLSGTYNQSAGSASDRSLTLASNSSPARYNLSGGSLTGNHIYIQSGTFNQTGGTISQSDSLEIDSPTNAGLYTISDGSYNADFIQAGYNAFGTIIQTGGIVNVPYGVLLGVNPGSHGYYTLAAGTLRAGSENSISVGNKGTGTFTQTGGSLLLDSDNGPALEIGNGAYLLSGGSISIGPSGDWSDILVSSSTQASFIQTGGSISSIRSLILASTSASFATYSLSGSSSLSAQFVTIADKGNATFSQSGGVTSFTSFTLANTSSSSATLNLSGGNFTVLDSNPTPVNYIAYAGSATVNQTGGTLTVSPSDFGRITLASQPGSSATYNLSAGELDTYFLTIGDQGSASFNQTGGNLFAYSLTIGSASAPSSFSQSGGSILIPTSGEFFLSSNSTASLSGTASLHVGYSQLNGLFTQSGGDHSIDSATMAGQYNLHSGIFGAGGLFLTGTFSQSGGTSSIFIYPGLQITNNGLYSLSAGTLLDSYALIGTSTPGTFNQTGGTHTANSALLASGSYNLSGGSLAVTDSTFKIGGAFSQSGGSVTAQLDLNNLAGGTATYTLSAGTLSTKSVTVADAGKAYFLQTGGFHSSSQITIASQPNSTGIYDLLAGSLSANSITNAGTFYMQPPASLTFTGNNPIFTNTGSATLDGSQSWPPNSIFSNTLVALFHSDPGSPTSSTLNFSSASPSWAPVLFDAPTLHFASINLSSTTHATLTPTSSYLYTNALSITDTAQLDLTTSTLLINDPSMSLDTLRQYLHDDHLLSTSANSTHTLAYTTLSLLPPNSPQSTTARSAGADPAVFLVTLALTGDINLDGKIDADDYALLDKNFAAQTPDPHWTNGDFNYDGIIDQSDYLLIDTAYAQTHVLSPAFLSSREFEFGPAYVSELLTSIPEPSLSLCLLAGLFFNHRLRSRRITL